MNARPCIFDTSFIHDWKAEILQEPPLIAPAQHFIYPQAIEEVELGALQILFRPKQDAPQSMATFALGFADPSLPHGLWACPNPGQICAVAGGYAYVVNTELPSQWMQIPYRPVTSIHVAPERRLLLFASFDALWALGDQGKAWETGRLSWEGLHVTTIHGSTLHGIGWDLETDCEVSFTVDLATGKHSGGAAPQQTKKTT